MRMRIIRIRARSRGERAGRSPACQAFFANFFGTILANAISVPIPGPRTKNPGSCEPG